MKTSKLQNKIVVLAAFLLLCTAPDFAQSGNLYRTISTMDSIFFTAYNTCDTVMQRKIYSNQIEFYHDRSGLNESKESIMESTKKFICGKVTRELVKGSMEVSPVPGYGAVEIGMHLFHNKAEPNAIPHPSKFVIIWHEDQGEWTITRVISLH
jgi:hypothetical protein